MRKDQVATSRVGVSTARFRKEVTAWSLAGLLFWSAIASAGEAVAVQFPEFRRGDANGDGRVDLSDAGATLSFLRGNNELGCLDAADIDDSGVIDQRDFLYVVGYLFVGGPTPSSPGPYRCGRDPTTDNLPCAVSETCSESLRAVPASRRFAERSESASAQWAANSADGFGPSGLADGDTGRVEAVGLEPGSPPGRGAVGGALGDTSLGGTNEPTIVVNPTNSQNVVYASLFSLRVSNNGGANFLAAVPAPLPIGTDNDNDGLDGEDPVEAGIDNDFDGAIDEDPIDGVDNDGDGLIDEDPAVDIDNDNDMLINEDPFFQGRSGDPSLAFDSQGRLFWTYLISASARFDANANGTVTDNADGRARLGLDVFLARVNPANGAVLAGYPVNVTGSAGVNLPAAQGFCHDKEWLAADCYAGSPFSDQLYVVWTEFQGAGCGGPTRVLSTFSNDQGMTWSAAVQHSAAGEGFVWPSHNTVAPNGDVYVGYHSQPGCPNGTAGQVFVTRSTNGGANFPQKTTPFTAGQADMTFNRQDSNAPIANTQFWLQGSVQPWILADPNTPGRIYVVANDDPDNNIAAGDPADVFIQISNNNGVGWAAAPVRIDSGPGNTFQVMPTAAIDKQTGCIAVTYYDNRNGNTNIAGNFVLDVFMTVSTDGGITFGPDFQINDVSFDPDVAAPCRYNCRGVPLMTDNDGDGAIDEDPIDCVDNDGDDRIDEDPPENPTLRIGEYNGVAVGACKVFAVWAGNTGTDQDGDGLIYEDPVDGVDNDGDGLLDEDPVVDGIDNDFDGMIDEDPIDGVDNDGDGLVDEDGVRQQTIFDSDAEACDTDPPQIACPADVTVQCDEPTDPSNTGTATATDTCDPAPTVSFTDVEVAGGCPPEKVITRTWKATDAAGNSNTCDQVIMVVDNSGPAIQCPGDVTITCGESTDPSSTGMATAMDNCDPGPVINFNDNIVPTTCPADPIQEVIEREWIATDSCGNSNSCLQKITVLKLVLDLDIKPGSCPNPLETTSRGKLPVALLGTEDFDVKTVVLSSVQISRADCVGGAVSPLEGPSGPHSVTEDVGTPFDGTLCDCHVLGGDGFVDLSMKFSVPDAVAALGLNAFANKSDVELTVSGELTDGCKFIATDCIRVNRRRWVRVRPSGGMRIAR